MPYNFCPNCGAQVSDNAAKFCSKCGQPLDSAPAAPVTGKDKPNVGLDILSFLIPPVGLILYFVEKDERPSSARSYLICCLCGVAFILFKILLGLIIIDKSLSLHNII